MRNKGDEADDIPEELLEEIREIEEELALKPGPRRPRKRYPSNNDIADAIVAVASTYGFAGPEYFPYTVKQYLEGQGFYTGLVNDKRIWRIYETLVRKGRIRDYLGVVW